MTYILIKYFFLKALKMGKHKKCKIKVSPLYFYKVYILLRETNYKLGN